jgi:hypothetical protein
MNQKEKIKESIPSINVNGTLALRSFIFSREIVRNAKFKYYSVSRRKKAILSMKKIYEL